MNNKGTSLTTGQLHNKSLDHLYSKQSDYPLANYSSLEQGVNQTLAEIENFLITNHGFKSAIHNVNQLGDTPAKIYLDYANAGANNGKAGQITFIHDYIKNMGGSRSFASEIAELMTVAKNESGTILHNKFHQFKNKTWETSIDKKMQLVFVDVFQSSRQYWKHHPKGGNGTDPLFVTDGGWVIINDAVGALVGVAAGPAAPVVSTTLGALFSLSVSEGWA